MGFKTERPSKSVMGFIIVNYSIQAVCNVFFLSGVLSAIPVLIISATVQFNLAVWVIIWILLTVALFYCAMVYRDRCVSMEIEEGIHDPVWGRHIRRKRQRKLEEFHEKNWITSKLIRIARFLGVNKN
ncbi:hypothetical protein F3477_23730 [Salmonella enterica]|nr:hypothetical protein [Salmonella enterica]